MGKGWLRDLGLALSGLGQFASGFQMSPRQSAPAQTTNPFVSSSLGALSGGMGGGASGSVNPYQQMTYQQPTQRNSILDLLGGIKIANVGNDRQLNYIRPDDRSLYLKAMLSGLDRDPMDSIYMQLKIARLMQQLAKGGGGGKGNGHGKTSGGLDLGGSGDTSPLEGS